VCLEEKSEEESYDTKMFDTAKACAERSYPILPSSFVYLRTSDVVVVSHVENKRRRIL